MNPKALSAVKNTAEVEEEMDSIQAELQFAGAMGSRKRWASMMSNPFAQEAEQVTTSVAKLDAERKRKQLFW